MFAALSHILLPEWSEHMRSLRITMQRLYKQNCMSDMCSWLFHVQRDVQRNVSRRNYDCQFNYEIMHPMLTCMCNMFRNDWQLRYMQCWCSFILKQNLHFIMSASSGDQRRIMRQLRHFMQVVFTARNKLHKMRHFFSFTLPLQQHMSEWLPSRPLQRLSHWNLPFMLSPQYGL